MTLPRWKDWLTHAQVLVVDDQPANIELLRRLFDRDGIPGVYGLTEARQVEVALDRGLPDLLLLDLNLPHMDGLELLERLGPRLRDGDVMMALVTADVSRDKRDSAIRLGVHDVLLKPFDALELMLRMRNLLEIRWWRLRARVFDANDRFSRL